MVIACEIDANPSSQLVTWVMQPFDKSEPIRLDLANVSSIQTSEMVCLGFELCQTWLFLHFFEV